MKKTFFSDYTEQLFQISDRGDQVFFPLGIYIPRPFVVPDQATKDRLSRKYVWLLYIVVVFILGISVLPLIKVIRDILITPWGFALFFFGSMAFMSYANWLLIRTELQNLKRLESRFSLAKFFRNHASHFSVSRLLLIILWLLFFAWVTWLFVYDTESAFIGWFSVFFIGSCEVVFIYMFWLKLTALKDKIRQRNKTEA